MDRRHFLGMMTGALLASPELIAASQGATPEPPQHSGRPRPVVLGDGIELIDYRIYPSPEQRRVIGEIWSTRDDMVDAPVVSMTFPDVEERNGFAYAPALVPAMRPGESNLIFGVIPDQIDTEEKLASAQFGLCGPVEQGKATERLVGTDPVITEITMHELHPTWLNIRGILANEGSDIMMWPTIHGLVRDKQGRYVGTTSTSRLGNVPPATEREFLLWASTTHAPLANPFLMLDGSADYSVDPVPGSLMSHWNPGCRGLLDR